MRPFAVPERLAAETADAAKVAAATPRRVDLLKTATVGTTPHRVVHRQNGVRLLHYEPVVEARRETPILLVYALINRPYILDLQPDRSVVRRLLDGGYDVYLLDWGEPGRIDADVRLADYVNWYLDDAVDVVRERAGVESISLLGYCMGGVLSAMYASRHPEKVRNLALMAAGFDYDGTGGLLEQWGDDRYFDPGAVTATFGNAPAAFLAVGFARMDPVSNFVRKYRRLAENLDDEAFVAQFLRMERWVRDGVDVAGETYREFVEAVYQQNALMENDLYLDGQHVDVGRIEMPVLQIVGTYDHLVPPATSTAFEDVIGSDDVTVLEAPTGHVGLSVSGTAHREVWPAVCDWFESRSGPVVQ